MASTSRMRGNSSGGGSGGSHAAVRVLLSQLYLTWVSSSESAHEIDAVVQAALAAAKQGAPGPSSSSSSSRSSSNTTAAATVRDGVMEAGAACCGSGAAATVANPAAVVASVTKSTPWYADPFAGLDVRSSGSGSDHDAASRSAAATAASSSTTAGASSVAANSGTTGGLTTSSLLPSSATRSTSPPVSSPQRSASQQQHMLRADEQATAAAAAAAAQSGLGPHFLGVDEIDFAHHRLGSPGVTPASPHARPVVDPMAPLPHNHATTTSAASTAAGAGASVSPLRASPPATSGAAHYDVGEAAALMTPVGEVSSAVAGTSGSSTSAAATTATASARDGHITGRVMHTSRSYSMLSPADAKRASVHDIPVFYTLDLSHGLAEGANEAELTALNELVMNNNNDSSSSGGKGGAAAAAMLQRATFDRVSLSVFAVPAWLKELLFETIAQHSGVAPTVDALTATQVSRFYRDVYARLTPTRRLFELIRGGLAVATATAEAAAAADGSEHKDASAAAGGEAKGKRSTSNNGGDDDGSACLTLEHFKNMTRYLVASHPGLDFLKQPEFQEYYCRTVAIRILYCLERQQSGKVTWRDFDRSNLPDKMLLLDSVDVNQVLDYFSYEHFYVLYCKFWELDTDRDLLVDFDDLCHYGQGSIVPAVIRRLVDGHGRPLRSGVPGKLDFEDFVYFCLSEEDKNMDPAVLYWFRVLDVDGDGVLSGYELSLFYRENQQRLLEYSGGGGGGGGGVDGGGNENEINYEDAMCQMLDMLGFDRVKSRHVGITLGDLRACPTPANFFNMIFNAQKFMQFERRDPFYERQQKLWPEKTDWDRFARAEYDRMAAEAQ